MLTLIEETQLGKLYKRNRQTSMVGMYVQANNDLRYESKDNASLAIYTTDFSEHTNSKVFNTVNGKIQISVRISSILHGNVFSYDIYVNNKLQPKHPIKMSDEEFRDGVVIIHRNMNKNNCAYEVLIV